MNQRNINLDIVRIFSALLVLSVHISLYANFEFGLGQKGVLLFFILSGYLAVSSLDKDGSIFQYYKNRAIRILPTYYFCLLIIYISDLFYQILKNSYTGQCGIKFLRYIFFIHCITPSEDWNLWNNHSALWTMSSFFVFYLIIPFLYKLINKFYKSAILLILLLIMNPFIIQKIELLFRHYPEESRINYFAAMNPLTTLYCFIFGVVLFLAKKEKKITIFSFIMIITLILTNFEWYRWEIIFTIFLAMSLLQPPITEHRRICNIIQFISQGTFLLYLIHPVILRFFHLNATVFGNITLIYSLYLYIVCFAITYFTYYIMVCIVKGRKQR